MSMPAINLTKRQMNSGAASFKRDIRDADLSEGGRISRSELKQVSGLGTAATKAIFDYAANIEFRGQGAGVWSVDVDVMCKAVDKIVGSLKKVADTKGNKNGRLEGNELKFLEGKSGPALARLIHNLKSA